MSEGASSILRLEKVPEQLAEAAAAEGAAAEAAVAGAAVAEAAVAGAAAVAGVEPSTHRSATQRPSHSK